MYTYIIKCKKSALYMQKYITEGRYTVHYAVSQDSNLGNQ